MKQKANVAEDLINQMFIIAGHPEVSYNDILGREDAWYTEWTMTEAQRDEWKEWCFNYLKKNKKAWTKRLVEREVAMFDLCYGLKIDDTK
jgi:hypothetical protein